MAGGMEAIGGREDLIPPPSFLRTHKPALNLFYNVRLHNKYSMKMMLSGSNNLDMCGLVDLKVEWAEWIAACLRNISPLHVRLFKLR